MKHIYTPLHALFFLICVSASAQIQIQNGGMELWEGFNRIRPVYWSTTEELAGYRTNKWVFRENAFEDVHSGATSIRLYSDTTSFMNAGLLPGTIMYGRSRIVNNKIVSTGLPVYGRPTSLSFFIKIYHPVSDTASMRLLLTRWNPTRSIQDTLANEKMDIMPDSTIMGGFAMFKDSIQYWMDGEADTARLVIYGGRRGDTARRGNTVWIDDLSFNYPSSQIVHPDITDQVFLYPNPAITKLHIQAVPGIAGYSVVLMDVTGIKVRDVTIDEGLTTIDVSDLPLGTYCYAVLDQDKAKVQEGNVYITRP